MDEDSDTEPSPTAGHAPIKTYSLEEVAEMVLPPDWKTPVRWLTRKLIAGDISGYKLGRGAWRMTHADVEDLILRHRNNVRPWSRRVVGADSGSALAGVEQETNAYGMTRRSWMFHQRAQIPGTVQYNRRMGIRPRPAVRKDIESAPRGYKVVRQEDSSIIANMPELTGTQKELLDRVRREGEVAVNGHFRKTVESLVRRGLVSYEVHHVINSNDNGWIYRFTVRLKIQ